MNMNTEEQYQASLDYLYSFVDYSMTRVAQYSPEQFNLQRMREFVQLLGNPEKEYPVIHIAGTKGKGSTAAMCASILTAAGYRVGLYTSPHLIDFAERIQIDTQLISHQAFVELLDEIKPILDAGTQLTTFEITTGLAFLYFARQRVDAAVIEVGLGGRLDATNIVLPKVTVITSISYDHTQFLGNTLAKIAAEKAGIIKPGVPVIVAPQSDEARQSIEQIAIERNSPLIQVGRDYRYNRIASAVGNGQSLLIWQPPEWFRTGDNTRLGDEEIVKPIQLRIPLLGEHQIDNAVTAYAAIKSFSIDGLPVSESDIRTGFSNVSWPARFEVIQGEHPIVLDCAHNRDSAHKLRKALDEYFPEFAVILVFGASEDKDIRGMLTELAPRVQKAIATRSIHPRAIDPNSVVNILNEFGISAIAVEPLEAAVETALEFAKDKSIILVTGSIFVAAGVRDNWYNRFAN